MKYRAPWWLPGGHAQTIWPALAARRRHGPPPSYRRERWDTPDGDFIDVDWLGEPGHGRPTLVLFHGLEGSSLSHYAVAFADWAREQGLSYSVAHFRGCSGEINLAPRSYHSGDHAEIDWILRRAAHRAGPLYVVGVSLGGNMLLRWAEEQREGAARIARAVAAVCAPLDLAAGARAIARGLNKPFYTRMFLATMKPKALEKLAQFPGIASRERILAARSIREFDDAFTAPLHGFASADDYYRQCSSRWRLADIAIPTLVLNPRNDPFVPAASLPSRAEAGAHVTLWQPAHGGHVGFAAGAPPGHVRGLADAVGAWLLQHGLGASPASEVPKSELQNR